MNEPVALDLAGGAFAPEAPGISSSTAEVDGARWALVEYEPGVAREEWCDVGHCGYVVAGAIEYEFSDGRAPLRLTAGQGFRLRGGQPEHRGRNVGDGTVRLFLIDDTPGES